MDFYEEKKTNDIFIHNIYKRTITMLNIKKINRNK